MRTRATGLALALFLVACSDTGAPPAVADSGALSPEETAELTAERMQAMGEEFAVVEVAARTQSAFRVNDETAQLTISALDPGGQAVIDETFQLRRDDDVQSPFLRAETRQGFAMSTFTLDQADSERILRVRQQLAALKAAAPGQNELNINAYVTGCLKDGHETPGALRLTFFIRIRPNEDFFPLTSEMELPNTGRHFKSGFWTPCGEKRGT